MRALIIDPAPHLAEADARLLQSTGMPVEIETITDIRVAMERTSRIANVDLVLYAIRSEQFRSYKLVEMLCHWAMGIPVIVLSISDNLDEMLEVQRCGATGYVPLNLRREVLTNVIRVLLAGGEYFPVWHYAKEQEDALGLSGGRGAARAFEQLTPRQREVLDHLARGLSNKQIATALGMSCGTTRTHVAAVLRVLGVRNRLQATKLYLEAAQGGYQ
jgi:DNA-binding NarL/FixJ family response regulator